MAYNSTIDKDTDDILIYGNTVKDGSGTDYVPLVDADGQLQVDVIASGLPTGASTLAEQQSQTTHLATIAGDTTAIETAVQLIDDTVYTDGAGTVTKGIAILGQDGTNPQAIKTDASGELQVDVLTMPTVAVTQSGTWDEVGINDSGNSITVDNPQLSVVGTGTEATAMRVTIATDSTGVLSVDDNGSTLSIDDGGGTITVDGTVGVSGTVTVGSHAVTNAGTFVTQENGAALTAMQLLDDTIFTDDATFTPASSKVSAIGLMADETSTDSVDEGDIGIPRMTTDRKQIATLYPSAGTTDGVTVANFNSGDTFTALTNTAQVIKASAGNFYGYYIYNPNSSATYVMLYNTAAASVTVGTTTPAMVFCIPATAGANLSLAYPIPFTNAGWSIAAATTGGGNAAPATALEAMIFYK